jgi:hypothetical protein
MFFQLLETGASGQCTVCECFNPQIHTGSQMQAIATATAKADIKMEGKKYGNLQKDLCLDNHNQHIKNKIGRNN